MPKFSYNFDFVPVSKDFIETMMPSANPAYVTVYLYIMMLAMDSRKVETKDIAKKLGLIESDVVNAIKFWNDKGALMSAGDNVIIKHSQDEVITPETTKKSPDEVAALIEGDSALSDLCQISQEILGKTLASNDLQTLYWFYDQLGFSPEIIAMLLEYCVSMDKRNMKYIEKVAITWHENNVTTIDEAQAYISGAQKEDEYTSSLKQLFGISDRKLSKTESQFLKSWREELNMSADMVGLAYEYCIIATSKMSFPYINTILKRWAEQGIRTIAEAEKDHEAHKAGGTPAQSDGLTSLNNLSDLELGFIQALNEE